MELNFSAIMQYSASAKLLEEHAIYVVNANKSYGQKEILKDFCMKVPKGCIYGLLGASGCGKTTVLSCVVGRKKLDSGDISVLGGAPGSPGSGIPGPGVGYMPQDIALMSTFTVKETIYYFGRILNMEDKLIRERFKKLRELLDLPPDNRYVKNCSGGQQRRISFAAAMVHNPKLLILDEPTVGLDPLLRDSLWKYLLKIAEEERTAVVITTHYIEEARNAHKIGLMRQGKLLVEGSPARILQRFHTDNLENVFLILSKRQEENRLNQELEEFVDEENTRLELTDEPMTTTIAKEQFDQQTTTGTFSLNKHRLKSLLSRNTRQIIRNWGGLVFALLFPCMQMTMFLLAIGGDVKSIPIAVINEESDNCNNYNKIDTAVVYSISDCKFANLSCRFMDEVQDSMFDFVAYNDLDYAFDDVRHGKVAGVMHMAQNFTEALSNRINEGRFATDEDLDFSEISVWLDMSNRQIGGAVKARFYKLFKDFFVSIHTDCQYLDKYGRMPMRFSYEYGHEDDLYVNFMVPGFLLTIIHFVGAIITCVIIVTERMDGIWDRSIVAGVSSLEMVVSHLITEIVLILVQTLEIIILTFAIYRIEYLGNMWLIFALVFQQGICGMCLGFLVSIISINHLMANVILTGLFYPMVYLSGILWPLEAQPDILKYISLTLPYTVSTISLRDVIKKNYTLYNASILSGLLVTLVWTTIFVMLSILAIKRSRK